MNDMPITYKKTYLYWFNRLINFIRHVALDFATKWLDGRQRFIEKRIFERKKNFERSIQITKFSENTAVRDLRLWRVYDPLNNTAP